MRPSTVLDVGFAYNKEQDRCLPLPLWSLHSSMKQTLNEETNNMMLYNGKCYEEN